MANTGKIYMQTENNNFIYSNLYDLYVLKLEWLCMNDLKKQDFEIAVVLVQIKTGICKTLYRTHSKGLSSAMRPSAALDLSLK